MKTSLHARLEYLAAPCSTRSTHSLTPTPPHPGYVVRAARDRVRRPEVQPPPLPCVASPHFSSRRQIKRSDRVQKATTPRSTPLTVPPYPCDLRSRHNHLVVAPRPPRFAPHGFAQSGITSLACASQVHDISNCPPRALPPRRPCCECILRSRLFCVIPAACPSVARPTRASPRVSPMRAFLRKLHWRLSFPSARPTTCSFIARPPAPTISPLSYPVSSR